MSAGLIISIVVIILVSYFFYKSKQKTPDNYIVPANTPDLLATYVDFYQKLDDAGKALFVTRVKDFLGDVAIRGVDVPVEDLDRVLVAAGAIIPIFAFPDWRYNNISEVLLYKGMFNKQFATDAGTDRNVLGMVGDGAMHREMVLSQPSLRLSFSNATDGHNTVIHEFVHLIDKADGVVDGVPEYLLSKPYAMPWIERMHDTIKEMRTKNHSDIDLYGATNDAEFLAVVSEYFFERPAQLQEKHPELYAMLADMFHPKAKK
jgi:Mlc titration factor MtfA (ptsG expression regulator)